MALLYDPLSEIVLVRHPHVIIGLILYTNNVNFSVLVGCC